MGYNKLEILYCFNNKLIALPILPNKLYYFSCDNNKIVNLLNINKNICRLIYDESSVKFISKLLLKSIYKY